jgi:hypothetical protein
MLHKEITEDIIGAAMAVPNELKPGLDEKLYENALVIELQARGRSVEQQKEYLNITGLEVVLLLNFKNAKLEWERVVNEHLADHV